MALGGVDSALETYLPASAFAGDAQSGGGNGKGPGPTAYYGETSQPQIGWTRVNSRVVPLYSTLAYGNVPAGETAQR